MTKKILRHESNLNLGARPIGEKGHLFGRSLKKRAGAPASHFLYGRTETLLWEQLIHHDDRIGRSQPRPC